MGETDYKNIRVPESAWEEAKAMKEENNQTWAEYVTDSGRGVDSEQVVSQLTAELDIDASDAKAEIEELQALIESLQNDVDSLEGAITNTANGSNDVTINETKLGESLADYLINGKNLPEKVAEGLR